MKTFITVLSLALFVALTSCTKSNEPPVIKILEPTDGSPVNKGDTSNFIVEIGDDGDRLDVSIQLKDEDLIAVGPIKRFRDLASGSTHKLPYYIEDKVYSNENHFIKVVASDGEKEVSDFIEIEIRQSDSEELLYVLEDDGNEIILNHLSSGNWVELARLQERVLTATFWKEPKLLMIQTEQNVLIALDIESGEVRWTKDFVGNGQFFTTNLSTPELFIQASNDEFIRGYDFNGNLDLSVKIPTGYGAQSISATDEYLMSYEKSVVGSQYFLRLYSISTSQLIRDRAFPFLNPIPLGGISEMWLLNPGLTTSELRCLDADLTQFPICQTLNYGAQLVSKSKDEESIFILEGNRLHILGVDGISDDVTSFGREVEGLSHTSTHFCAWHGSKVLTYRRSDMNLILNPETSNKVLAASYY